jgi:hypothetical protein
VSSVTHVCVVAVDHADAVAVEDLSGWISQLAPRRNTRATGVVGALLPLTNLAAGELWGGVMVPLAQQWARTLNGADLDALLDHVARMPWTEPEALQVLLGDEEDSWFFLYMIRGGELRQDAPLPVDE